MTAIMFGSIGTLADTSELQREAFNAAFEQHGLGWSWSQPEYQQLLSESGGEARVTAYAQSRQQAVDAGAVHATKSELFQRRLREGPVPARSGVVEVIDAARRDGVKLALVTTTSAANLTALGEALAPEVDLDSFDLVLSAADVSEPKPAPDIYALALQQLGESPETVVAIEDNVGGVQAASSAGVTVIAFPGENNAHGDFSAAEDRVEALTPAHLSVLSTRPQS